MGVKGQSHLPLQATPDSEDSKDRDVARERTRPECQNEKLGSSALKSAERVRGGNYFRCRAIMPTSNSGRRSFNPARIWIRVVISLAPAF